MAPEVNRSQAWDQAAINRTLSAYRTTERDKDVICEQLWWFIRDEVMISLRRELRDELAVDEAEFLAFREFSRRLEKGTIRFLSKAYLPYICRTAARFVRSRRAKLVAFESDGSPMREIADSRPTPEESRGVRYADLYFCLEKLSPEERALLQLHHCEDRGLEESARAFGIEHDAARKRHSRAIQKLRLCLEKLVAGRWT